MKCPFCNTEMIPGYLNSGAAIWSERKHKISMLPECKKIIIDGSDYENNLG